MKKRFLTPLALFVLLSLLLGYGLTLDPRHLPSPLVGKPAPEFELPRLMVDNETVGSKDMLGHVWLMNIWATWCVSCRAEHHVLNELSHEHGVTIMGLDYKDERAKARQWLTQLGNPYVVTAFDEKGRIGIDWGVTGTPETFVVDKKGVIRHKHVGPVTEQDVTETLLPLIRQLEAEPV